MSEADSKSAFQPEGPVPADQVDLGLAHLHGLLEKIAMVEFGLIDDFELLTNPGEGGKNITITQQNAASVAGVIRTLFEPEFPGLTEQSSIIGSMNKSVGLWN